MLLQNIRAKIGARLNGDSEAGFTLIELLVVMLILGILAAIALPAFFNQKSKATDAKAKENAHSAQVAMETCATENSTGTYVGCTAAALKAIEPTLPSATAVATKESMEVVSAGAAAYEIKITAATTENTFSVARASTGATTFPCTAKSESNRGGCPSTNLWSS